MIKMRLGFCFLGVFLLPYFLAAHGEAANEGELSRAVERGIAVLMKRQENLDKIEGHTEWPYQVIVGMGDIHRDAAEKKIPLGYRVAGTAICAWCLLELPGWEEREARRQTVYQSLDFILHHLKNKEMGVKLAHKKVYDERGWGHIYALTFLVRLIERDRVPDNKKRVVREAITQLIHVIEKSEVQGEQKGGWSYHALSSHTSFMTASALQALFAAQSIGVEVDSGVIERAVKALEKVRLDSGAFQYVVGYNKRPGEGFESIQGAIGRMAVCESTLFLVGKSNEANIRRCLDAFFEHWKWLEKRRQKKGTHMAPYGIAPYYFFYAHYYTAQAIELLPEEERGVYRSKLNDIFIKIQEERGGWKDTVFDRSASYSTAMVLLAIFQPEIAKTQKWFQNRKKPLSDG